MARHQKSLLEAFQSANDERAGGDPASAGPFAGAPTTNVRSAERRNLLPAVSARDSRVILSFAGWGLLTFVIGVLAGSQFGPGESLAGERASSDDWSLESNQPVWEGSDLSPGEEVNVALDDERNRYTVVAFSCPSADVKAAMANYENLARQGLPVAFPIEYDGKIYVLVGAVPETRDLDGLLAYLRTLGGPGGASYAYSEAYPLSIDNILTR